MMFASIRNNSGYIFTLALWSIVGMISTEISIVVILTHLILFFNKQRYFEALFGMFFLFALSDNLEELWSFASVVKPYYLLVFGALCIFKYKDLIKFPMIVRHFSIYLLIALVCIYYSVDAFVSIQKVISFFLILLVVPNIVLHEYRRLGKEFFSDIVAYTVIIHFISIAVLITFPEVGISHGGRWRGMFGNPNGLGLFLISTYTLYRAVQYEFPGIFTKKENIFYTVLVLIFLWMSGSRTAMFSIITFEFILFGFRYSKGITLILAIVFMVYFDYLNDLMISALASIGLSEDLRLDNIEEGSGRIIAWSFAWQDIQKNTLLLGRGLGYDEHLMRSNAHILTRLGHEGGVHNSYLIVWLNTGIIGLVAFLSSFISFFVKGYKRAKYAIPLMFAVFISANFEPWITSSLNPYTSMLLVTLTLMLAIDDEEKKTVENIDLDD
jgi:O-antigen ligase